MRLEEGYQQVLTEEKGADVEAVAAQTVVVEVESEPQLPKRLTLPHNPPASLQGRLDWQQQRLNTKLLSAAAGGNLDHVKRALSEGANVNSVCRDSGLSACHIAAYLGHTGLLQYLLDAGAKLRRDLNGIHPLHLAVWHGHFKILELLVNSSIDTDIEVKPPENKNLDPSSMDSWNHDHSKINELTRLLPLPEGATALHMASQWTDCRSVKLLLNAGASCTVTDARGFTPLDVVGELADVQVTSQPNSTAHPSSGTIANEEAVSVADSLTIPRSQRRGVRAFNSRVMQYIVDLMITQGRQVGCDTNEDFKSKKMTPLHTAVERGNLPAVKSLLENNFDATILNKEGLAPLHLAVREKNFKILKAILNDETRRQKVINLKNGKGFTPLHMAVLEVWVNGIYLLLEAGADVMTITSFEANTVLHLAAEKGNANILNHLLSIPSVKTIVDAKNTFDHTALMNSVISNDRDSIEALLNHKADILCTLKTNTTILHLAALHSCSTVMEFLLSKHLPDLKNIINTVADDTGRTPLHDAALRGCAKSVESLLRRGADATARIIPRTTEWTERTTESTDKKPHRCVHNGMNALHLAARKGRVEVVEVLLKHKKDLVAESNSSGWYPLHIAAKFRHRKCVEEIIRRGGNLAVSVKDEKRERHFTAFEILRWSFPQPAKIIENVLNAAITSNGYPCTHSKWKVTLQYDVLFPSTTSSGRQMFMLMGVLNANDEELTKHILLHPLVETFLYLKWKKLCGIFWFYLLIHSLFTVSLTASAILTPPANGTYNTDCFNRTNAENAEEKSYDLISQSALLHLHGFFDYCTLATFYLCLFKEFLQAFQKERYYWLTWDSWLKWSQLFITFFYLHCSQILEIFTECPECEKYNKHAISFAVLLAWINLLTLLSRLPKLGLYILMFLSGTRNFIKACCAFWVLFLGFTFAFAIQFEETRSLSCLWARLMKVIVMTSEFEYSNLFPNDSPGDSIVGRIIFLIFIVLIAVVLMNLLIGLTVTDTNALQLNSKYALLSKQVEFLNLIEGPLFFEFFQSWTPTIVNMWIQKMVSVPNELEVRPGNAEFESWPRHLKESILKKLHPRRSASGQAKSTSVIDRTSCELESDFGDYSDDEDINNHHEIMGNICGIQEKMDTELHSLKVHLHNISNELNTIKAQLTSN